MSGFGKCLADVLRNDTLSVAASTFVTAYPLQFNAASAVPTYLYQCLQDIWLTGTTTSTTKWADQVTDSLGPGNSGARTIDVITTRIVDQIDAPEGYPSSNEYGAEFAEIYIYFKLGGAISAVDISSDRVKNAELRTRFLLDYNWRVNTNHNYEIPITDLSINSSSDNKAYWKGVTNPQSSKDAAALYCCTYTRLYL